MNVVGPEQMAEALKRAQEIAAKMAPGAQNGGEDPSSRKRPLDEGDDGPQLKKPSIDTPPPPNNPQAIAQAAIAKLAPVVGAQLGMSQMISVEILIPNRMVGLVIGRGGDMINKLQSDSAARIQVAPDGSEVNGERSVSICGTPETVERAKALVNRVIEDAGGATSMPSNVEPGEEVREMSIPANKVGLIIGKGGEMIKMLQDKAGCKMQMIQDGPYAHTPEKPLRMTGRADACERAKILVKQLMDQKDMEYPGGGGMKARGMSASGGRVIEVQVPKSLVGFVIGRQGEHINNIQNTCGVRLQFQNDIPGTDFRMATISGPPIGDNCERAKKMIEDIVGERQMAGAGGGPIGGAVGGGGGYRQHVQLPNPSGPGVQSIQFPVPANKCGLIIGKGGETIRELQVASGCHIELFRGQHPNPSEKLFNIRGTPQEIQEAQALIRQKCEMGPGGGDYGGQMPGMPYPQPMFQQGPGAYAMTQYPYPQGYGGPQQQAAAADPSAAWAAYYQQLYAAQAGQQQPGGGAGQPPAGGGQGADITAQWAEYYRQLGVAYYGQQGGGQHPPGGGEPPEQKALTGHGMTGSSGPPVNT